MKHAGARSLDMLSELLTKLRGLPGLKEKKPGTFYRGSMAFLHFHEDPLGLFADVKLNGVDFERQAIDTKRQQERLLKAISASLGARA